MLRQGAGCVYGGTVRAAYVSLASPARCRINFRAGFQQLARRRQLARPVGRAVFGGAARHIQQVDVPRPDGTGFVVQTRGTLWSGPATATTSRLPIESPTRLSSTRRGVQKATTASSKPANAPSYAAKSMSSGNRERVMAVALRMQSCSAKEKSAGTNASRQFQIRRTEQSSTCRLLGEVAV